MSADVIQPRERRTLIIGACTVAALLIGARGLPRAHAWLAERNASAAEVESAAARAGRSVRDRGRTRMQLALVSNRLAQYDSALVEGGSAAEAGSNLAALISESADAADASLASVQLRPARDSMGVFAHVAATASVSGDLESIAIFLQGLEAGPQLLAVRELSITQPESALPPNRRETLRVEVGVEGLYRRSGGGRP